jgi:hypothetical protein
MQVKLTDEFMQNLQPPAKGCIEISDTLAIGFNSSCCMVSSLGSSLGVRTESSRSLRPDHTSQRPSHLTY